MNGTNIDSIAVIFFVSAFLLPRATPIRQTFCLSRSRYFSAGDTHASYKTGKHLGKGWGGIPHTLKVFSV